MCINAETSMIALSVGQLSGLSLLLMSNDKEKQIVGLFIMFYSLVQLFEYNIYKNNNTELNTKLLLLNLSTQGLFLFFLLNKITNVKSIYFIITGIVLIIILYHILTNNIKNANVNKCIKWNFMTPLISGTLVLMYLTMFFWMFFDKESKKLGFLNSTKYYFLFTYFASVVASKLINNNEKIPSYWCMSSAILAPILALK